MAFYCFNSLRALLLPCWGCLTPMPRAGRHTQQGTSQLQFQRVVSVFPWLGCTAGRISRFLLPGQLRVIFRALWSCSINRKFIKKSQLVPSPVFILKLYLPVIFLSNFKSKPAKIIFGNINLFLYTVNKKCRNAVNPLVPFKIFPEALLPVTPSPPAGLWSLGISHLSATRPHSGCNPLQNLKQQWGLCVQKTGFWKSSSYPFAFSTFSHPLICCALFTTQRSNYPLNPVTDPATCSMENERFLELKSPKPKKSDRSQQSSSWVGAERACVLAHKRKNLRENKVPELLTIK